MMPDISIQLYAQPNELLSFAANVISEFKLHVVAMRYPPFDAVEIERGQFEEVFRKSSSFREIAFTVSSPMLPVKGRMEFIDKNPDQLSLQIGRQTNNGLEPSSMSGRTDNQNALAVWKKIANKLKKQTMQGITAINRETGISAYNKSTRYTKIAKLLETDGVAMLPLQGPNGPRITLGIADATA
ncbi:MAG: hypothetical protein R3C01_06770 [Planctomycetaceae bacterium]